MLNDCTGWAYVMCERCSLCHCSKCVARLKNSFTDVTVRKRVCNYFKKMYAQMNVNDVLKTRKSVT